MDGDPNDLVSFSSSLGEPSQMTQNSFISIQTRHESQDEEDDGNALREQDRFLPIANVARIMKKSIPAQGKIAKDARECVQECVSEFISFITSEASDRCQAEKRKTINGEDILFAMSTLGFDNYIEPLKLYLQKYRDAIKGDKQASEVYEELTDDVLGEESKEVRSLEWSAMEAPPLTQSISNASTLSLTPSSVEGTDLDSMESQQRNRVRNILPLPEDSISMAFKDNLIISTEDSNESGYIRTPESLRYSHGYSTGGSPWMNESSDYKPDRGSYIPYPGITDSPYEKTVGRLGEFEMSSPMSVSNPIELQVTNLDQTIDQREMKRIITGIFREHVNLLHICVFFQSDGNMAACVRVPTVQDAQLAISQLHRKKIGYKRILISYSHNHRHNSSILRLKVVSLLSEVPSGKLQLFKFREMFEKRYHNSVGISDLYKMKDIVVITEEDTGRMISLNLGKNYMKDSRLNSISSPNNSIGSSVSTGELDSPFCLKHAPQSDLKGWAEKENENQLPLVLVKLPVLAENLKILLRNHCGSAPLASIVHCYNSEFESLIIDNDNGVPLEHLLTCIKSISVHSNLSGMKKVSLCGELEMEGMYGGFNSSYMLGSQPPQPLAGQLSLFSRELVDLLKMSPGCRMLFHKFIPSYHHHFGRQCRVADYGYTKLKELFEALPHIVQILGEGSRAVITLSHRSQTKRFTMDLIRVLKAQASKQVTLVELPSLYEIEIGRPFKISDYGVCYIEDILCEVSETSVVLTEEGDDMLISISKREQTSDELERTKQFSAECVELLRHAPDCRLPFNKFIPAYHHHFGRQCRVADYGFTKLIELFEAIPLTAEVTEDCDGERLLQLTDAERLIVIGEQIAALIRSCRRRSVSVKEIGDMYTSQYGYQLRPDNFGEKSIENLLEKFDQLISLDKSGHEVLVSLSDKSYIQALSMQVKTLLSKKPQGKMSLKEFVNEYMEIYNVPVNIAQLKADLSEWIEVHHTSEEGKSDYLCLTKDQLCLVNIQNLLKDNYGRILFTDFESTYAEKYGAPLNPSVYGYSSIHTMIQGLGDSVAIRGKGMRKMIVLMKDNLGMDRNNGGSFISSTGGRPKGNLLQQSSFQNRTHMNSPNFPTRYSGNRQDGIRIGPPRYGSSPFRAPSPDNGSYFSSSMTPTKYNYSNEMVNIGNYPTSSPHGNFDSLGACSPMYQQQVFMKQVQSSHGLTSTPPSRRYGGGAYQSINYNRSPDSLCNSSSPTSSCHFTDDERNQNLQFTPSPLHHQFGGNKRIFRNNSAPSMLGMMSRASGSPVKPVFGANTIAPIAVPMATHIPLGPSSPASPLSPGIPFSPFIFPPVHGPNVSYGIGPPQPPVSSQPKSSGTSKSKLGSIFEESYDDFKIFPGN